MRRVNGETYGETYYDEQDERYHFHCEWCETSYHGSEEWVDAKADRHITAHLRGKR